MYRRTKLMVSDRPEADEFAEECDELLAGVSRCGHAQRLDGA